MDVNLDGNTITNAYLSGIEGTGTVNLTDATVTLPPDSVTIANLDATGTPSSTTYLRGDGTWSNPTSGGAPVTLTGDAVGSGTGTVPVTVEGLNGTSLAGLATGLLKNTTATGVPSIAVAGADYLSPAAIGTTVQPYNANTTTQGNTFNGASELLQADSSGYILDSVIRPGGKLIYVSQAQGNDTRTSLSKYSYQHPFATYTAAVSAAAAGDTLILTDGIFISKNNILKNNVAIIIMPLAYFLSTGTTAGDCIFTDNGSAVTTSITGFGQTLLMTGSYTGACAVLTISTTSSITINNLNASLSNGGTGGDSYGIYSTNSSGSASVVWNGGWLKVGGGLPGAISPAIYIASSGATNVSFSGTVISTTAAAILNVFFGTITVGALSDASGYTSAGVNLTITSPQTIVQALTSPSTGFSQAFNYGPQDQNMVITPSSTLATGTVTFPADGYTRIGQKLWISNASAYTITSLTVSVSGGTIYGYTTGPLPPGSIMFQKTASNVWEQVSPRSLDSNSITTVTGTSQAAAPNEIYITNNASLVTITLPSVANVGDTVEINGLGAGGWLLAQNASQVMHMSSASTTTGTGGSVASTNQYNTIKVRCIVASTTWVVIQSQGTLTVT